MPRSIWKGVMSFGMVAIPVRLYLATESSSKVSFNLLCPEHKSRIKNKRFCVEGDHEVAWGDVVRGYEYEKGSYVELTDEDLEKLPLRSSKAIDITGFIKDEELPGRAVFPVGVLPRAREVGREAVCTLEQDPGEDRACRDREVRVARPRAPRLGASAERRSPHEHPPLAGRDPLDRRSRCPGRRARLARRS